MVKLTAVYSKPVQNINFDKPLFCAEWIIIEVAPYHYFVKTLKWDFTLFGFTLSLRLLANPPQTTPLLGMGVGQSFHIHLCQHPLLI